MVTVRSWESTPGILQEVLRVQSDDPAVAGYYVKINDCLYSTRPVGSPEGLGLWQVNELPGVASPEPRAAELIGLEVRRVLIAAWIEDDTRLALVLDLGRQKYLQFHELRCEEPALNMSLSPDCGEVEQELTFGVEMPYVRDVTQEVRRPVRMGRKLLGLGAALFISAVTVLVLGLSEMTGELLLFGAFVLIILGMYLIKRKFVCPWCGEKEFGFGFGSGVHHYFCDHCQNGIDTHRMRS